MQVGIPVAYSVCEVKFGKINHWICVQGEDFLLQWYIKTQAELSDRGLCDGLITRPEESYRLWRVVVCDQETSQTRRLKPATGL